MKPSGAVTPLASSTATEAVPRQLHTSPPGSALKRVVVYFAGLAIVFTLGWCIGRVTNPPAQRLAPPKPIEAVNIFTMPDKEFLVLLSTDIENISKTPEARYAYFWGLIHGCRISKADMASASIRSSDQQDQTDAEVAARRIREMLNQITEDPGKSKPVVAGILHLLQTTRKP